MMDADIHPNISRQPIDCPAAPSNGKSLLSNSLSCGLIPSDESASGKPSNCTRNNDLASSCSFAPKVNMQSGDIISKIEDILHHMVDCIADEKKELVLRLKPRIKAGNEALDEASGAIKCSTTMEARAIRFPGKTAQEAWKFSMLKRQSA
jgi:hypothetical protein